MGCALAGEKKATVREVAEEVHRLNPEVAVARLMKDVEVSPDDPSHVSHDLDWSGMGISKLPDIIGDLTIWGYLNLSNNQLSSLPEGFGSLRVWSGIGLADNQLNSLPESFGSLKDQHVRNVDLRNNPIAQYLSADYFDGLDLQL